MKNYTLLVLCATVLLSAAAAPAAEISGTITSTLVVTEDSWLVGDVTCRVTGGPCIRIDASNVTLWLNGFTMTGQGDPPIGCLPGGVGGNLEQGIQVNGPRRVEIFGPGLVQKFRGSGVLLTAGTTRHTVKDVTSSSNCNSGIFVAGASDSDIESNVSVGNGNRESPCGGVCVNGNFNRVRNNVLSGNGYALAAQPNFGVGLVGASRGNIIEKNNAVGNSNGVFLAAGAVMNLILNNVLAGNPPIQFPLSIEGYLGFDIRNLAPESTNTFHGNLCTSYSGAGTAPCPSTIRLSGR